MPIETLDDIIDGLADKLGIYGAHDEEEGKGEPCRVCWTSDLRAHILAAVQIEHRLYFESRLP